MGTNSAPSALLSSNNNRTWALAQALHFAPLARDFLFDIRKFEIT